MGLKEQTIHASKWNIGSSLLGQIIQLCFSAVMARLLMPADFGIYGMALVFITFLQMFSQLGLGAALVQKKELTEDHLSSVFWLNLVVGFILCVIYVLSAPLIALFFHQPILKNIVYILAINFIITSLSIVQGTILTREMRFKKLSVVSLIAVVCSGFLGIILAVMGFGVWSLIWSAVFGNIISASLMWYKSEWNPKFIFCFGKISEMISFSLNALGFNVVTYFSRNIQDILIGRFMNPAALGYYSMANRIMLLPLQHITLRVGGVTFPAFSKIQHDKQAVRDAYAKTVMLISLVTFPLMIGLLVTAPELITVILGDKWGPVVILVQILSITGLFQSIASTAGSIMLSQGKADMLFKWGLFSSPIICAAIFIGLRWGVNGVAISYTLTWLFLSPILMFIILRMIDLKVKIFLKALLPATAASMIMFVLLISFRYISISILLLPKIAILLCSIILAGLIYIGSLVMLFPKEYREMFDIVRTALPSFKNNKPPREIKL